MAYTALETMRQQNERRFGADLGPMQPPYYQNRKTPNDLKSAALRFLRERCEQLHFDPVRTRAEMEDMVFVGKSLKSGQIPYNMEMHINQKKKKKSLETFIGSGVAEDVYTCY